MSADQIRYDLLVQEALRSVVRRVLSDAARDGLPGEHRFNISFRTRDEGVSIPSFLTSRYPEEMAIILQHEFWDLIVADDHFQVSLNFSRKPERLVIPFTAITGFSDPSVPFGFKIEAQAGTAAKVQEAPVSPVPAKALEKARASDSKAVVKADPKSAGESAPKNHREPEPMAPDGEAQKSKVVSIDAFR